MWVRAHEMLKCPTKMTSFRVQHTAIACTGNHVTHADQGDLACRVPAPAATIREVSRDIVLRRLEPPK